MKQTDFIFISQSETVQYDTYTQWPLSRVGLFEHLIFPRLVRYKEKFHSHLDLINQFVFGCSFFEAPFEKRRQMLSVWSLPSFSGLYLANYLKLFNISTAIINNFDAEQDIFEAAYKSCGPEVTVGLSTTFHLNWSSVNRLVTRLRSVDPEMHIIAGGAMFPSLAQNKPPHSWKADLKWAGLNAALFGMNSEEDLKDYLTARKSNSLMPCGSNVVWFDSHGTFHTQCSKWRPPISSDWPDNVSQINLPFLKRTLQLRTSVGCPFSCSFCSYPVLARGFYPIDLKEVELMLKALAGRGLSQLVILDDTVNISKSRLFDLGRIIDKNKLRWFAFVRAQMLDEETVMMMRDTGCQMVFLGLESGHDSILANMRKKANRKTLERGVELLRKYDIKTMGAFIIGFPGENDTTIKATKDFIENGGLDFYTLKEFFYIPGAGVGSMANDFGLIGAGDKWSHKTMNSTEASAIKADLFKQIKSPVHLDADTSLWGVVTMLDAGFTMTEATKAQQCINQVVKDQMNGFFDDHHPGLTALSKVCDRLRD